ncbi:unnamed protein product [Polarella glacialis]|uniref:Fe2OG dioxygenase domain-containing protein n=1 Tax=Polarella glacialis TaxID=89957 RepID=A0A813M6A0_POLGL|nr:unnamed protein product [Polarella glacialis]
MRSSLRHPSWFRFRGARYRKNVAGCGLTTFPRQDRAFAATLPCLFPASFESEPACSVGSGPSGSEAPYTLPPWLRGRPGRNDRAVHLRAEDGPAAVVLEPGLVVLRQALSREEQVALAAEAWDFGARTVGPSDPSGHGFFEEDGGLRGPMGSRGRIFEACCKLPSRLSESLLKASASWVRCARAADATMPKHEASHLLLLYYRVGGTLGFHRDEQANDGTGAEPVVNLSLGAEIDFALRHEHSDVARVVTLRSGDVLLFGGPCRRLLHAVAATRAVPDTVLPADAGDGRLSFTLRHAPEVTGHEYLYADFRPQPEDPKRKLTGDELLLGSDEAQRRLRKMSS